MTKLFAIIIAAGGVPDFDNDDLHVTQDGQLEWTCPLTDDGTIGQAELERAAEQYLGDQFISATLTEDRDVMLKISRDYNIMNEEQVPDPRESLMSKSTGVSPELWGETRVNALDSRRDLSAQAAFIGDRSGDEIGVAIEELNGTVVGVREALQHLLNRATDEYDVELLKAKVESLDSYIHFDE